MHAISGNNKTIPARCNIKRSDVVVHLVAPSLGETRPLLIRFARRLFGLAGAIPARVADGPESAK